MFLSTLYKDFRRKPAVAVSPWFNISSGVPVDQLPTTFASFERITTQISGFYHLLIVLDYNHRVSGIYDTVQKREEVLLHLPDVTLP